VLKSGLSFRTKLILAMFFVIAGVTGATVVLTQRRMQAAYQKLFEQQFRTQIEYFSERQLRRLELIAERCTEVARESALVTEMESPRPRPEFVYQTVVQGLAPVLQPMPETAPALTGVPTALTPPSPRDSPRPPAGGPVRRRALDLPDLLIVDATSQPLAITSPLFEGMGRANLNKRLRSEKILKRLSEKQTNRLRDQEIGYSALAGADDASPTLREYIITPIRRDADTAPTVGALIVTSRVDFGEQTMFQFGSQSGLGQVASGLWIDKRLYTSTIPEAVRSPLAKLIDQQIERRGGPTEGNLILPVNGVPHRAIFSVLNPDSPFGEACHVALFSLEEMLAEQTSLRWRLVSFGLAALVGSLGLVWLISHGLTRPIRDLVAGTHAIRRGRYDVALPVRTRDEIGQLTASFNDMAQGLALSQKYQTVLAQVTDREVAETLIREGPQRAGELRSVTTLFCDIRGFTSLSAHLPPARVVVLLNEHMTALTAEVAACGGVVDKFVGDMIMAVFGAPKPSPEAAIQAGRCALRMQAARARLNAQSEVPIEMGIGLATGEAIAGCMGSADRLNYTVIGPRVNLAARLCSAAAGGQILLDDATLAALGLAATATALEPVKLKGFAEPVPTWALTGLAE
jgi:class 3 adenylate cyclase